jgi:hypothetical protein
MFDVSLHDAFFANYPIAEQYPSGYPRVAATLNCDTDGRFCRRFGYLRTRALLSLQRDLTDMEDKLQEMDEKDDEHVRTRIFLWSQQEDRKRSEAFKEISLDQSTRIEDHTMQPETRQALLRDIKKKMEEYGTFGETKGFRAGFQAANFYL